jgi:predicted AAA+ superfamily ATPase
LSYNLVLLLAGRAFVYQLFPFTYVEVKDRFKLHDALRWGLLPKILTYNTDEKKQLYLDAYTNTYLKEEIWATQFVRELDSFRHFLEVAAQANGKITNFLNISRNVGVASKTVEKYFSILEDTLLGFFLNAFQHSFRKRLSKTPKFYFFDPGIVRALTFQLSLPLQERTSAYGEAFEHFVILQCKQLARYFYRDYRFSYLQTKDGAEIDLVVERPGQPVLFIEIKSNDYVQNTDLTNLRALAKDFGTCEAVCFSRDPYRKQLSDITIFPWDEGVSHFFLPRAEQEL